MESKFKLPTETIELPSKGVLYPEDSPLASGTIEMKYMTAREEDILTNQNYITQGIVLDKLLQSLIVTKDVDFNQLLIGDKNALFVAARILSYGNEYKFTYAGAVQTVDLSTFDNKPLDESLYKDRKNEFELELPHSKNKITFKLLTHGDEKAVQKELDGLKKINKIESRDVTTRLKHTITSVNGQRGQSEIRDFVDNWLLAKDARILRDAYTKYSPDVDLTFTYTDELGGEEDAVLPITFQFFWPEA